MRTIFNTGMYELIKRSTDEFYSTKNCKKIPVMDKQGNLVETKFRIKAGNKTFILWTCTTQKVRVSSMGGNPNNFFGTILPKFIRSVKLNLQQNSVTAAEINKRFQNILLSCASAASDSQDNLQENLNDEHEHELKTLPSKCTWDRTGPT